MAKILIRNGTISSSADYTLNRDTTQYIKLENGLIIFTQDVLFANDITSSANISSSGYISGSHLIGDGSGIYNLNPSNINMENLVNGNGIVDFTYNGQSAATVAVDPSIAGNKLTWNSGVINHDVNGASNISLTDGNIIQSLIFDSDGHTVSGSSYNLDNRYYTETESDNRFAGNLDFNNGIIYLRNKNDNNNLDFVNLDNRYYTEVEADNRFVNAAGDVMTGILQLSQISASNAAGLKLYNNNNNGILIQDNGDVSFSNNISASAAQFITNEWIKWDNINAFRINSAGNLEFGTSVELGNIELEEDSGQVTFVNMPVTSAPSLGNEQSYAFAINSEPVLKIYSEADGAGGINNKSVIIQDSLRLNANEWIKWDNINAFRINSAGNLEFGTSVELGNIELEGDSGRITFLNMPVTSAPISGNEQSYAFAINSEPILTVYSEADGAGGIGNKSIQITGDISGSNILADTLYFGDGDTGFYESDDDVIQISIGGNDRWTIQTDYLHSSDIINGGALKYTGADNTVPTLIPAYNDLNTGIGHAAEDQLSLIAGGIEGLRITKDITTQILVNNGTNSKPSISFINEPTTGFNKINSESISVIINGNNKWTFQDSSFGASIAGFAAIQYEAPSNINPVFIPNSNDDNTGIGHAANDQLSLIAGGVEGIRIINNQSIIQTELSSSGNIYFDKNIIQQQFDTHLGSETYLSGFAGHGWQIDNISSSTMATFDDLTVRGTMNIYELLIHQIRATNGSIWVSNTGKVSGSVIGTYTMSFDDGNGYGHGFANNDIIKAQRWDANNNNLYNSVLRVDTVISTASLYASKLEGNDPQNGYEYVRIGNATNTNRQGSLYLTADDNEAPYLDVIDGVTDQNFVNHNKVRLGKLNGVTSPSFGALSGYGLWASGSVYLEGAINADRGWIAGWEVSSSKIISVNSNIELNNNNEFIRLHASDINDNGIYLSGSGETLIGNKTGNHIYYDGIGNLHIASDDLNITASDIDLTSNEFHLSTNNVIIDSDINNGLVSLGSNASANNISSFNGIYFDGNGNAAFGNNNTGEYITFNGNNIVINTNNFSVDSNGNVSASNAWFDGTVSASAGNIGNWNIINNAIKNGNLKLSANGEISSSNFFVSNYGNLTASNAQIEGDITASAGQIAGWNINGNNLESEYMIIDAADNAIYKKDDHNAVDGYFIDFTPTGSGGAGSGSENQYYVRFGPDFAVSKEGTLIASGAVIEGVVTASGGLIGGWRITDDRLHNDKVGSVNEVGLIANNNDNAVSIYAGGFSQSAPFRVTDNGNLYASSADITGNITANSGFMGNWSIVNGEILNNNLKLSSNGEISSSNFFVSNNGNLTASNASIAGNIVADILTANTSGQIANWHISENILYSNNINLDSLNNIISIGGSLFGSNGVQLQYDTLSKFYAGNGNNKFIKWNGENLILTSSDFRLQDGNVNITGNITANSGFIGDWEIYSGSIINENLQLSANGEISSSNFFVSNNGDLTASNVDITGDITANNLIANASGQIANWNIGENTLYSNNINLDSLNNVISIGGSLFGSNGVQLQYDTAGELYAGNGTNKYLQYSSGEVEIKANNFSLTTANGLQLSGSVTASELLVGNVDSNNYLQYNNNNFNAKFENFSASGDSVYISSSNFLLNNGIITANGGEIAGWTINSDYIRDNNNTFYLDSNSSSLYIINKSENKIIDVGSGSLTNLEFLSITNLINNGTFSSPIGTNWYTARSGGTFVKWEQIDGKLYAHADAAPVGGNITEELYLTQSFDIANTSYDIGDSLNIIFDAQPSGSNIAVATKWASSNHYLTVLYSTDNGNSWNISNINNQKFNLNNSSPINVITGLNDSSINKIKLTITSSYHGNFDYINLNAFDPLWAKFDNFNVYTTTPKVELKSEGLLVYNNPDKYIKANNEGIVIKGNTITTNDLEVYGNATIFGGVSASNIPPYDNNPENVATFADVGSSTAYSRGDHIHALDINNFINGTLNEINITDNLNGTATLSIPFSSSMASKIANNEADIISIGNYTASLANNLHSLTSNEISQLLNINSNLISNTEWGYLASLNQSLTTTSDVQFNIFTASNAQLTNIVSSIIEANTITASNAQFTTNEWITWDNINAFRINTAGNLEFGTSLEIGNIELEEDSGQITFVNMPVTSAPSLGDEQSYAFALNSENILTIYSEADGVGGVQNKSIKVIGDISSSGYISGSHIGDGNGLTNINPSNINIETLTIGDGLFGVSYNGTSAVTISVNSASVHHGDLQGLVDDDHNQYALLNGRNNDILNIDQIKAFDDTGLKLTDTANNGIMIENGGNITGSGDLHLEGNITASGVHFSSMVVDTYIQTPEIRGDGTSITFTDNIIPESDNSLDIGSVSNRWQDIYAATTTVGAVFEHNLHSKGISKYDTGTVLIWKDGKLSPCNKSVDKMIMGVVQKNREEPIIMGAEPVLVAGKIKEGDYVVTSKIRGCARKLYWWENLLYSNIDKRILGKSLQNNNNKNKKLINVMIK